MFHHTPLIATLVAGFVLAFGFGFIAGKLRISPIVGYLLAGIAVGPHTPGFAADLALANELAEMGIIFLMFGVGLHFSVKDLMSVKAIAVPGAIAQIAAATALGTGMGVFLGWGLSGGLVFGLSLSVASTVVLLRALEEHGILDTRKGRIAVGWLVVEDLVTVLALVLMPAIAAANAAASAMPGSGISDLGWSLAVTLGKVAAFVILMVVVGRRVIPWMLRAVVRSGSREVFTLSVLAVSLGIAYGSAVLFGVSFALGAFFAGMVLAESELSHRAAEDTLPLRDAFAVLFFVSVGMLIDPAVFIEHPVAILSAVGIIVVGKSSAAYLIVRAFGHAKKVALTISASLAQIGEFSFVLIGLGITLGLVPEGARDIVLAAAMATIMLNPVLFAALDRYSVLPKQPSAPDRTEPITESETETDDPYRYEGTDHAVIVGYNRLGKRIAESLAGEKVPVVILDPEFERVQAAREDGHPAVLGNGMSDGSLDAVCVAWARCVVTALPHGIEAAGVASAVRKKAPDIEIMGIAVSDTEAALMEQSGANYVLNGERKVAENLVTRVRVTERVFVKGQETA